MTEAQPQSRPDELDFPQAPPVRGRYYITDDNYGGKMVICSHDTWVDFGTTLESLRQMAAAQDKRIKELLSTVAAAGLAKEDAVKRLNALRDVRRGELRSDIESGTSIYVPPLKTIKGR